MVSILKYRSHTRPEEKEPKLVPAMHSPLASWNWPQKCRACTHFSPRGTGPISAMRALTILLVKLVPAVQRVHSPFSSWNWFQQCSMCLV